MRNSITENALRLVERGLDCLCNRAKIRKIKTNEKKQIKNNNKHFDAECLTFYSFVT